MRVVTWKPPRQLDRLQGCHRRRRDSR